MPLTSPLISVHRQIESEIKSELSRFSVGLCHIFSEYPPGSSGTWRYTHPVPCDPTQMPHPSSHLPHSHTSLFSCTAVQHTSASLTLNEARISAWRPCVCVRVLWHCFVRR